MDTFTLENPAGESNHWLYGCMLDSHRGHYLCANLVQLMPEWVTNPADSKDADRYCAGETDSELGEYVTEAAQEICERFNEACHAQGVDAVMGFREGEVHIQPGAWKEEIAY